MVSYNMVTSTNIRVSYNMAGDVNIRVQARSQDLELAREIKKMGPRKFEYNFVKLKHFPHGIVGFLEVSCPK